ncbi:MAG: zinc-ribbon and DUF3426 domain-containing protein [Gallionellaceae bacterium]
MSTTTLCPTCNTRFKISQEQLEAHNGLVRCGRCQAVFDAREYLQDDTPSPQLDLPILENWQPQEEHEAPDSGQPDTTSPLGNAAAHAEYPVATGTAVPIIQAEKIPSANLPDETLFQSPPKQRGWPLIAANIMLLLVLLGQCAYFFRIQLAASMPGLKPALVSYCKVFHCTVPLPRKVDLMSIESSSLEADPLQPSVITLNAILRNQAPYIQAFPNMELTFTDEQNSPVGRRTFSPAEYLGAGNDEQQGFLPNHEFNITLNLDTSDLRPSGYKLFIF